MFKIKAWVSAARLRTLPLSVSGILVGSACAYPFFFRELSVRYYIFVVFANNTSITNIVKFCQ
jgi:1,4-dihydroxy-2-naphthoate octaprenyltransferase